MRYTSGGETRMSILNTDLKYSHGMAYEKVPFSVGTHTHPYYEIVYYLRGTGKSIIAGKEYDYGPATFAFIPKNMPHSEIAETPSEHFLIGLTFNEEVPSVPPGVYSDDAQHSYHALMQQIRQEYEEGRPYHRARMDILAEDFLIRLLRRFSPKRSPAADRLELAIHYINSYYTQEIDLKEIAAITHYSYDRFRHLFTQYIGVSPQKYVAMLRLSKAKKLLEDTALPIKKIAAESGYNSPSALIIDFKNIYGVTPVQYRKQPLYEQDCTYFDEKGNVILTMSPAKKQT